MLFLLTISPLIWILRFKDKVFGLIAVISLIIAGNTFSALFLQSLGLFRFNFLLILHLLFLFVTLIFNFKEIKIFLKRIKFSKIKSLNVFLIISFLIISLQFYFVHFNYTGEIVYSNNLGKIENFNHNYPIFSDEWIAVGMSEKSIETGRLPFTNFLTGQHFSNLLFVFQSMVSSFDLILDMDLLHNYKLMSVTFSLITIVFSYVLLRNYKISIGISCLCIFLISYLPNSSNLPILWYLLPWNIGLIFLMAYLISVQKEKLLFAQTFNILSIVFYPPLAILSVPSFIFLSLKKIKDKEYCVSLYIYLTAILGGLIFALIFISSPKQIFELVSRSLNSSLGQPPLFIIYKVIPLFVVPFAFWSLWNKRRELPHLTVPIFIGLILWIIYSLNFNTIFIDYHRTAAITGIFLIIISSFSFERVKDFLLKKIDFLNKDKIKLFVSALFLLMMFILSFGFTERTPWKNFTTLNFKPAPPVNNYLIEDDLELFKDIKNEVFLSTPWKSLALAVATKNIPVTTKPSTITVNKVNYPNFIRMSCDERKNIVDKLKIKYLYIQSDACPWTELMGKSSEGFSLYLVE